jgi:hypothetical protein
MKKSTRSQQSNETKKIITKAKKMVDVGEDFKIVCSYIKKCYEDMARENYGFFDNLQYQKALKSVVDYM